MGTLSALVLPPASWTNGKKESIELSDTGKRLLKEHGKVMKNKHMNENMMWIIAKAFKVVCLEVFIHSEKLDHCI